MLSFDPQTTTFSVNGAPIRLTEEEKKEIDKIYWWHTFRFSDDVATKGFVDSKYYVSGYLMDTVDFKGKSVLDIGCWDGFQLFYAESNGAARVVGLDKVDERPGGTAGRDFAKRKLQSKAEWKEMSIYNVSEESVGQFDIVMMYGVLYHLVHPMLGIERACSVAKNTILLSTHYLESEDNFPWVVLYPGTELADCFGNWSGPNLPWIRHALDLQGFTITKEHKYQNERIAISAVRTGERKYPL